MSSDSVLTQSDIGMIGNSEAIMPEESETKDDFRAYAYHFVINNYTDAQISALRTLCKTEAKKYIFGFEIAPTTGTPHIQGYFEFKNMRWRNALKKRIGYNGRMEKAKSGIDANYVYCGKTGNFESNVKQAVPLKLITELRDWQQHILTIVESEPDDRTIHWFWEPTGKIGKSVFTKYLCALHGAQICAGKAADMKCQIAELVEKDDPPRIIIMDIPRESMTYVSYPGIEEIKNGCFSSPKFKSRMCLMNCPHVIIFANTMPDTWKMSEDRWKIMRIDEEFPVDSCAAASTGEELTWEPVD